MNRDKKWLLVSPAILNSKSVNNVKKYPQASRIKRQLVRKRKQEEQEEAKTNQLQENQKSVGLDKKNLLAYIVKIKPKKISFYFPTYQIDFEEEGVGNSKKESKELYMRLSGEKGRNTQHNREQENLSNSLLGDKCRKVQKMESGEESGEKISLDDTSEQLRKVLLHYCVNIWLK